MSLEPTLGHLAKLLSARFLPSRVTTFIFVTDKYFIASYSKLTNILYFSNGKQTGKQWKQWLTLFFWTPKSLQMVNAAMKLKDAYFLKGKL